jgi:hypothetical protein
LRPREAFLISISKGVSREQKGADFVPVHDADSATALIHQNADSVFSRGI